MVGIDKALEGELKILERWAKDVQERLGTDQFQYELVRKHVHREDYLTICVFDVSSKIPSREVKQVIREEAVKYRQGRLYFMGYNSVNGTMFLEFYSFHLCPKEIGGSPEQP